MDRRSNLASVIVTLAVAACETPDTESGAAEASDPVTSPLTLTAIASEDVTVREAHPTENFSTLPLSVVQGTARESYLKFAVIGLPAGATVTSATVRLFVEAGGGTPDGPKIYRTPTTSWSENTMTWNTRPGATGNALGDIGAVIESTWIGLAVTAAVTGNGTYSFTLVADSTQMLIADSRESTNKPQLVVSYSAPGCPSGIDRSVIQLGSETRPAPGSSYVDNQFAAGAKIIRVTGDGNSSSGYPLWGAFSVDKDVNGRTIKNFHLQSAGVGKLYTIDTASDAVTFVGDLFPNNTVGCGAEDAAWSHKPGEANILYCHSSNTKTLYAYNVATKVFTVLEDFTTDPRIAGEVSLCQMSIDKNDNAFTFHTRGLSKCGSSSGRLAIAWDRSTHALFVHDYTSEAPLDETQMDKNGQAILSFKKLSSGARVDVIKFREGDAGIHSIVTGPANGYFGLGHSAPASGIIINEDAGVTGWEVRTFANPDSAHNLMQVLKKDGSLNWRYVGHISINHADERFFFSELWVAPTPTASDLQPWEQEIVAVAADGSWIKRLAHHHSVVRLNPDGSHIYDDEPRASASYDGKYLMFSSNYDNLGRDVYVMKVPPICQ